METLLTVEQYANLTQLHPDSVRRQLRAGRLRAIKKGRVWRIPASVVHEDIREEQLAIGPWKQAAQRMAPVYAESLANDEELTAVTVAPGKFHQSNEDAEA